MFTLRDRRTGELFDRWSYFGDKRRRLMEQSWAGVFRNHLLVELPVDDLCRHLDERMGRPSKDLYVVIGVLLLQQLHDLSDAETVEALAFNMAWHYALDVRSEADSYFCEKTLRNYRRLFIEQGLDELLFRCLTDRLVQGFSVDTSHQRMDSTALRSAMRALTRLGIVVESPSGDFMPGLQSFREHESNGRELDEGERVAVEVLPVLGQSAAAVEPGDGAFDHPTPGLDDEALHPIGSLDDLGLEIGQDAGQGAVKDRALIGAVGEQFPEKGKQTEQGRQQRETAVAILNVGGGDDAVQQQALRIDQNMPLLALDQLAGIEAVAVDASPPFSALFTL